ncbi:hypothetical protein [Fusobacterium polymorphum]|jgi:hypothetical protein|uniref:hypothetical protein n=2 Tax=Fusobacterium nucleatum subsp. polymorphum TaxID=76857 RepID=UPI0030084B18
MDAAKKIKKSLEKLKAIELEKIEKSKKKLKKLEKKVQEERNKKLLYEFKDLDDFNLEKVINFVHQLKEDIKKEEKEKVEKN